MPLSSTPDTPDTRRSARRLLPAAALAVALGLGLSACGDESPDAQGSDASAETRAGDVVTAGDPWVRSTQGAEDTTMSAAFMTLDNDGDSAVTLAGAQTPVAGTTELHEMTMDDGAMVMQAMSDGLEISAGRGKLLEPGGYHVMLMDLQQELAPGDEVELTLEFSDGSTLSLVAPVKEFTEEEGHYHEPGTDDSHEHSDDQGTDDHSEDHDTDEHSHS